MYKAGSFAYRKPIAQPAGMGLPGLARASPQLSGHGGQGKVVTPPSCSANLHEAISGTSHPMLETLGRCWVGSGARCPVQASASQQLEATWRTFPSRAGPELSVLRRPSPVEAPGSQIVVLLLPSLLDAACTEDELCESQVALLKLGNACSRVRQARHCRNSVTSWASCGHEKLVT